MPFQNIGAAVTHLTLADICLRLLCAMVVGLIIGTEREYTHRPAGMRTHILVALGSCAVMITGELIFNQYQAYGATPDPARLSAQVITGVGFLGAGTILREGPSVKGLTTAASLWSVACLGIAAGAGYYTVAIAGMMFIFITLTIFEALQKALIQNRRSFRDYILDTQDVAAALDAVNLLTGEFSCELSGVSAQHLPDGSYRLSFRCTFGRGNTKERREKFFQRLAADSAVSAVHVLDEHVTAK